MENSLFLKVVEDPERFRQVYTKLYETLQTSQFHWYFTEESEAKGQRSHLQWFDQDCVLWEVNVPVGGEPFRRVCSIAWNCLLMGSVLIPDRLRDDWKRMSESNKNLTKKWKQNFNDFWMGKSEDELWGALFLEKCVDGCTAILLRHPLEDSWIVREPIKDEQWWKMYKGNACGPKSYDRALPCDGCAGRK